VEVKILELKASGDGILKIGRKLGIGTSVVQRVFKQAAIVTGYKGIDRALNERIGEGGARQHIKLHCHQSVASAVNLAVAPDNVRPLKVCPLV
jgi:hypothetical protein